MSPGPVGRRALPLLSGVLLALSFPPVPLVAPVFFALVPLLVYLEEQPPGPAGRWSATRAALITGGVYFGLQLYWFAVALHRYSPLAIPAYVGAVLVLAGLAGLFGWALHSTRDALPLAVRVAVLWTTLEWVQGHMGDLAFPWLGLGTALAAAPEIAGAADLVGSRGLTLWIAAINGLLATAVLRLRAGRSVRPALAAAAILLVIPASYGVVRARSLDMRPVARVAVVQPDLSERIRMDRDVALDSSLAALVALTSPLASDPVDLVAWPEVALPVELQSRPDVVRTLAALSRRVGAPILLGAYGSAPGVGGTTRFNSAFLVDSAGLRPERYDKRRLVPFVERVPFLHAGRVGETFGDPRYYGALEAGRRSGPMEVPTAPDAGVLICYESIFGTLARDHVEDGAAWLVNLTNDGWFGPDTRAGRTAALWQHPAHLPLRAIENRRGAARVANRGFSMFVDPAGRVSGHTDPFSPGVRIETVYTTAELTLFTRWGDWLATLSAGLAAALLLGIAMSSRRAGARGSPVRR